MRICCHRYSHHPSPASVAKHNPNPSRARTTGRTSSQAFTSGSSGGHGGAGGNSGGHAGSSPGDSAPDGPESDMGPPPPPQYPIWLKARTLHVITQGFSHHSDFKSTHFKSLHTHLNSLCILHACAPLAQVWFIVTAAVYLYARTRWRADLKVKMDEIRRGEELQERGDAEWDRCGGGGRREPVSPSGRGKRIRLENVKAVQWCLALRRAARMCLAWPYSECRKSLQQCDMLNLHAGFSSSTRPRLCLHLDDK